MRKLLTKLNKWYLKEDESSTNLSRWQRDIIYDFIIDYIREVKKENGK